MVNDSIGPKYLAIVSAVFAIGLFLFAVRIHTRAVPTYKLNACDYALSIAVLAEVATFSQFAAAVAFGFGCHTAFISAEDGVRILRCLFGISVAGLWASTLARVSVALLLLQFSMSVTYKVIIWIAVLLQIGAIVITETLTLLHCRPIRAMWEPVDDAVCLSNEIQWISGYLFTGVGIFGDLIFAVMPMVVIWRLRRSAVERCLISCLLGMGLFATSSGVVRIFYMKTFNYDSPDIFREIMPTFFWCRIEEVTLIAAASAPLLKSPVERAICRLGLTPFQNQTYELESYHSQHAPRTPERRRWHNLWMLQEHKKHEPQSSRSLSDSL